MGGMFDIGGLFDTGYNIGTILGGGEYNPNTSTVKNKVTPADWNDLETGGTNYAGGVWNDFINGLWNAAGYANNDYAGTKYADQKNKVLQDLIDATTGIGDTYLGETGSAVNQYEDTLGGLSKPAFNIGVAGQNVGVTPKRNAMLADMATNLVQAQTAQAGRKKDVGSILADLNQQLGTQEIGMNKLLAGSERLWPYVQAMQGWRFGLPSSTESATYNPSLTEIFGNLGESAGVLQDLWKNTNNEPLNQNNQTEPNTYPGYGDNWYDFY